MGFLDRFRKGKGSDSSGSSEESFDLDDDALFGSSGDSDEEAGFGSLVDLEGGEGDAAFATMDTGAEDLGAAATADFDDFDDLSGSLGGDDLGGELDDDFGDGAVAVEDEEEAPGGKKKKKKKGKKAKKPRAPRARGSRKALVVTLAAAVVGLAGGMIGAPIGKSILSGEGKKRATLEAQQAKVLALQEQLRPLKRAASPEEVQTMQTELATRREQMETVDAIAAKVADLAEQRDARDLALVRRDAAADALAVRQATLANVAKQTDQIEARVTYLQTQSARFERETAATDDQVRQVQEGLPVAYIKVATAEATRVLRIQDAASGPPAE